MNELDKTRILVKREKERVFIEISEGSRYISQTTYLNDAGIDFEVQFP